MLAKSSNILSFITNKTKYMMEDFIHFASHLGLAGVRHAARDWDRIRITWGNHQSGCTDICSYSKRATVGVRAPYVTRRNSGMKRIKCG